MEEDRLRPPGRVALPSWLDVLSARVARWPWWAIIIAALLVIAFYSIATSDFYRRALSFVTNNPELTTDRFTRVVYEVKGADGKTTQVSGVISAQTATNVTIITQEEERVTVERGDIAHITCDKPASDGSCPLNQPVSVMRSSAEGTLLLEDRGRYQIKTPLGETVNVLRITVLRDAQNNPKEERTPAGCSANPDGGCNIKLTLNTEDERSGISGVLVESTQDWIAVQTVPPQSVTIDKTNIVRVLDDTPAQCALNNIPACNEGIFLTIGVTFLAYFLAIMLGLAFGLMRVSSNPVLFNVSTVYVEIVRGVPLLVILLFVNFAFAPWFRDNFPGLAPKLSIIVAAISLLLIIYYILTLLLLRSVRIAVRPSMATAQSAIGAIILPGWSLRSISPRDAFQRIVFTLILGVVLFVIITFFGAHSNLDLVQRAVLGLAFGYGAFTAELFRAGIQSIGRGQMEAARSLGMSYFQAMRYIVLPQAFRVILPPLGNDFIAMLKDTSLIAILALPELTQKARLFASFTFRPFEAYITIGVLYLCMTLFLSFMVRVIERRTNLPR